MEIRQVHISPFDLRGEPAFAVRTPYHKGFVEAIKVLIDPTDRSYSQMKVWLIKSGGVDRLHQILGVMFFPEEFCTLCWAQQPCIEWQIEFPRVEGALMSWPPPAPPKAEARKNHKKKSKAAPKAVKQETGPTTDQPEPRKPKSNRSQKPRPPEPVQPPPRPPEPVQPAPRPKEPPPPRPEARAVPPRTEPPPRPRSAPTMSFARAAKVLNLPAFFTAEDVRASFRKMALSTHPDRPGGSAESFLEVKEAADLLFRDLGVK